MLSNLKGYFRPKSIPAALALLEKNSGSILVIAGGTKLLRVHNHIVQELVDITELGLAYVEEAAGEIRIGATTTIQQLVENPALKTGGSGIVSQAAYSSHSSKMIRNGATLGGELVSSSPLSVLYCAMLVLQAQVRIAGGEEFALAMNVFLHKKGLRGGLLVEVIIPKQPPNTFAAIVPICGKDKQALVCAAARVSLDKGICREAKVAITGTDKVPQRLHPVEALLEGRQLNAALISAAAEKAYETYIPISDQLASEEYRREVGHIIVKRSLVNCLDQANERVY